MQLSQARAGSKRGMGGTGRKTDPSGPRPNVSLHLDVPPMPLFDPPLASAPRAFTQLEALGLSPSLPLPLPLPLSLSLFFLSRIPPTRSGGSREEGPGGHFHAPARAGRITRGRGPVGCGLTAGARQVPLRVSRS